MGKQYYFKTEPGVIYLQNLLATSPQAINFQKPILPLLPINRILLVWRAVLRVSIFNLFFNLLFDSEALFPTCRKAF